MGSLYAEMWLRLVASGGFASVFLHRTGTTVVHARAPHSLPRGAFHEDALADEPLCIRVPPQRLQISNWSAGGFAVAVESCVFLEPPRCHVSAEKKRILEKGAKKKKQRREPTPPSLFLRTAHFSCSSRLPSVSQFSATLR